MIADTSRGFGTNVGEVMRAASLDLPDKMILLGILTLADTEANRRRDAVEATYPARYVAQMVGLGLDATRRRLRRLKDRRLVEERRGVGPWGTRMSYRVMLAEVRELPRVDADWKRLRPEEGEGRWSHAGDGAPSLPTGVGRAVTGRGSVTAPNGLSESPDEPTDVRESESRPGVAPLRSSAHASPREPHFGRHHELAAPRLVRALEAWTGRKATSTETSKLAALASEFGESAVLDGVAKAEGYHVENRHGHVSYLQRVLENARDGTERETQDDIRRWAAEYSGTVSTSDQPEPPDAF